MTNSKSRCEMIHDLSTELELVAFQYEGDLYYQLHDNVTEDMQQEYEDVMKLREALKPFLNNEVIHGRSIDC